MGWVDSNTYEIATADDFIGLSSLSNVGMEAAPIHINVTADIDLTHAFDELTEDWMGTAYMHCIFNGNGHTISHLNLTIPGTSSTHAEIFAIGSGQFGNVTFDDWHISTTASAFILFGGYYGSSRTTQDADSWCIVHDLKINNNCQFVATSVANFYWYRSSVSSQANFEKRKIIRCMINAYWESLQTSGFVLWIDGAGIVRHLAVGGKFRALCQFCGLRGNQIAYIANWSYIFVRAEFDLPNHNPNAFIWALYENGTARSRYVYACYGCFTISSTSTMTAMYLCHYDNYIYAYKCLINTDYYYDSRDRASPITDAQLKDPDYLRDTVGWLI